jgi:hypothetical protein
MDLGRGNLLFPNLWGDIHLLEKDDVRFLAAMSRFARARENILLSPRALIGDVMANEPYGYAYFRGSRGLIFLNNMHFAPREVSLALGPALGLRARRGARLQVRSAFPERRRVLGEDRRPPRAGDTLRLTLRPFEVLVLEISRRPGLATLPAREAAAASRMRSALDLHQAEPGTDLDVKFADADRFSRQGYTQSVQAFQADLPSLDGPEQSILCVVVRLRKDGADWKYSPTVCEIVQATARTRDERILFVPVPDARQFGNTQKAGCSWVVYKTRMPRRWAGARLRLAVHALLPAGVTAHVEALVVRRWWTESARPAADGYYADAPS